ncbi:hypothetical protein HAX54_008713 [Datura stramonium]|uniref:Uncharacterized protein n=1 Tax=Datura stramonium TaxID=4076 RepID=A0ABS8RVM6_DATST|nr:hypothetical protein [Datura stramonium]
MSLPLATKPSRSRLVGPWLIYIFLKSCSLSWHIFSVDSNFNTLSATTFSACNFVAGIFGHALEDPYIKFSFAHSLFVCIFLLDPRRYSIIYDVFFLESVGL